MFTPQQPVVKPKTSNVELTPRDDLRKQVSEILKRVDQLIRKGELPQAQLEVARAKELDPRNVYALAFEERIGNLLTQEHESQLAAKAKRAAEADAVRRFEEERAKAEEQRLRVSFPTAPSAPQASAPGRDKDIITRIAGTDSSRRPATVPTPPPAPKQTAQSTPPVPVRPPEQSPAAHGEDLRMYREYLESIWKTGAATPEELNQGESLRALLSVSASEHETMQREVRMKSYVDAVRQHLSGNAADAVRPVTLESLRTKYSITENEHSEIEAKLLEELQRGKKLPSILVIDDDTRLLSLLTDVLSNAGFDVIALPTSDEAFALLRKFRPDLILCDINLETSTMGGFTFYEKIQERPHLQDVPFVFLTGLTDEVLVRTGKELGVDDYLTKPISDATLVATLRGKLKRYRQLRTAREKSAVAA